LIFQYGTENMDKAMKEIGVSCGLVGEPIRNTALFGVVVPAFAF
jgi:hypothetical protein